MKNISALDRAGMNLCKLFLVDTTLTYSGIQQKSLCIKFNLQYTNMCYVHICISMAFLRAMFL
jgi:hypothetical protein